MSTKLAPTPGNFRAEIARHWLVKEDIATLIKMNPSFLSSLLNEREPLRSWAANNIAWAINQLAGIDMLETKVTTELQKPPRGRPQKERRYKLTPQTMMEYHHPPRVK